MRFLTFTLIFYFFILSGCDSRNQYYLLLDKVDGLNVGNPVFVNGHKVGEVNDVSLTNDYRILVSLMMEPNVKLPNDSKVLIHSDFLGNNSVLIKPEGKDEYYSDGDTLQSITEPDDVIVNNPVIKIINSILSNQKIDSSEMVKLDSLLIELRKLNQKLENLPTN